MAASFPHFLYGDAILGTYVDGLKPKREAHDSFVIVEPVSIFFYFKFVSLYIHFKFVLFSAHGNTNGISSTFTKQSSH